MKTKILLPSKITTDIEELHRADHSDKRGIDEGTIYNASALPSNLSPSDALRSLISNLCKSAIRLALTQRTPSH